MKNQRPFVSIIIVNYNGRHFLKECLDSLFAMDYPQDRFEVLLVDNGSTDGSLEFLREHYPGIKTLQNDVNNYCRANNLAIKYARAEYVALLNNDIKADKNWLIELVRTAQKGNAVGAVGSKILFMDGSVQSVGHQEYPNFYWGDIGFGDKDDIQYGKTKGVTSLCGCSVLYKRECLDDVGFFDEDFNLFMEDVDISIRCAKKGWKLLICPQSVIFHKLHGTIKSQENARYWQEMNRLLLIAKHWPEKLPDALSGRDYFMAADDPPAYERDISTILGKVYVKLVKEHGPECVNKISPKLFVAVRRIYNFEKRHLADVIKKREQELAVKDQRLISIEKEFESFQREKAHEIASKAQEIRVKDRELATKDAEIASKAQEIRVKDQELATKDAEIASKAQEIRVKDQELTTKDTAISSKGQELASRDFIIESQKRLTTEVRKELDDIRMSTGYQYLLKPLWKVLWPIKIFVKKVKSIFFQKRTDLKQKGFVVLDLAKRSFRKLREIAGYSHGFKPKDLLKKNYLNHLKFNTFPPQAAEISIDDHKQV